MRNLLLSALVLLLAAQGPQSARDDYRAGRYEQSLEAWRAQIEQANEAAAPEWRLNAALAALRLLRSRDAEQFVAPLVEHAKWAAEAAFLLGVASRQHAERAVTAAKLADAEPFAWGLAVRAIVGAEQQFREACRLRPDWAPAVRNLERCQRRRAAIERARDEAKAPDAKQEQAPAPPSEPPASDEEERNDVVVPEVARSPLTAAELRQLQQRVRAQQQQKVRVRQAQPAGTVGGGRDW